jgi:hypothetical protein
LIATTPDSSARNFFSIFIAASSPSRGAHAVHDSQITIKICNQYLPSQLRAKPVASALKALDG